MDELNENYNPFADVITKKESEELRDVYFRFKVLNEKGKIVAHCSNQIEAEQNINQRRIHAPLVGHAPRSYTIKVLKLKSK